jgi:hypothetical protein
MRSDDDSKEIYSYPLIAILSNIHDKMASTYNFDAYCTRMVEIDIYMYTYTFFIRTIDN